MASQLPVKASFPAASQKILSEMLLWASPARWECKQRLPKYFNSFSEIEGEEKCEESFSLVASMRSPVGVTSPGDDRHRVPARQPGN